MKNIQNVIIAFLLILIIITLSSWAIAYFTKTKTSSIENASTLENQSKVISGKVTAIDPLDFKITINETPLAVPTPKQKTLNLESDTVIYKTLLRTQESGEKTYLRQELNVSDVLVGDNVVITYLSDDQDTLSEVKEIYLGEEEWVNQGLLKFSSLRAQGPVISFDVTSRILKYEVYPPTALSTTTLPFHIPTDLPIFKIKDSNRFDILHARTPATISDIKPGQTVSILIDPGADDSSRRPTALIISE